MYRLARYPISSLGQYMEAALWPQVRRPDAHGVISHESALAIYGLSDASPAKVHLTLPTGLRIRRAAPTHLVIHYADLEGNDYHRASKASRLRRRAETRRLSTKWLKRLGRSDHSDSAALIREDRDAR